MNLSYYRTDTVTIEDGPTFSVRELSAKERDQYLDLVFGEDGVPKRRPTGVVPSVVSWGTYEGNGEPVFTLEDAENLPAPMAERICERILQLSRMMQVDLEEAEGNSDGEPTDAS